MNFQKILIGALAGLVAGALIGLLMAPASGNETREKIAGSAKGLKRRFRRGVGKAEQEMNGVEPALS